MASKYYSETRELAICFFRERPCTNPVESATAMFHRVNELTGIPVDT